MKRNSINSSTSLLMNHLGGSVLVRNNLRSQKSTGDDLRERFRDSSPLLWRGVGGEVKSPWVISSEVEPCERAHRTHFDFAQCDPKFRFISYDFCAAYYLSE